MANIGSTVLISQISMESIPLAGFLLPKRISPNIIGDNSFCLDMGSSSCTYKRALSNISLEEIPIIFFKFHVFFEAHFVLWLNFVTLRFFFWTSLHSAQLRMCSRQFPGTEGWNSPKSFWLFHHRPQVNKNLKIPTICVLWHSAVWCIWFHLVELSLVFCSCSISCPLCLALRIPKGDTAPLGIALNKPL